MKSEAAISAKGMTAGYGAVPVLTGLDLHVNRGEVVALMGANGAGKSTTMKALCGLITPTEGTVELFGEAVTSPLHKRARQGVRYVSEERSIIRSLTTSENLRLGPGPVEDALAMFPELERLMDRPAGLLSGGEQQILTLARALSGDISVLLADELSLGLAPLIVKRLLDACRQVASERGVAVLLVEQHAHLALQYADRGYVLNRGQVTMSGTSAELSDRVAEIESSYLGAGEVGAQEVPA